MTTSPGSGLPPSRRERRKQETRTALEEAALALFAAKGYEQTTVEEIAEAAGVAVRTFFRYFSSKQHVLFGDVAHQRLARLRTELAATAVDQPPLEAVAAVLDALDLDAAEQRQITRRIRLMDEQPSLIGMYLTLMNDLRQVVVDFVAERTGLPPHHPYPLLVAGAAVTSWDVALCAGLAEPEPADAGPVGPASRIRRAAFAALTAGIPATPPPR
ncbi:TetR family transcriptional regulator [Polymorphospora lycopeni]|uniref:TetR family transcriptional regulator n=1 Tax=Polymorphospora lycopeni TaxID=3140240 RepID=A0ABV5CIA2_9ACTN